MASHREESMSLLRFPNRQIPSDDAVLVMLHENLGSSPVFYVASHGFTAHTSRTARTQLDEVVALHKSLRSTEILRRQDLVINSWRWRCA